MEDDVGKVINEDEKGYVDPDGPTKNPKMDIHRGPPVNGAG